MLHHKPHVIAALASVGLLIPACACAGDRTSGELPSEALRTRLAEHAAKGAVLFGHHDDPVYGHTWCGDAGRSDVLEATGKYPAIMSWDFGGIEKGDTVNLDGVPFSRIRREAIAHDARGGINTFSWHPFSPVADESSWEVSDTTIVRRMMTDPEVRRRFDEDIAAIADFLNSLRDAEGRDIAVIFRPWHEHTGGWFWWGTPNCTPEQYRFLWEETRRVMDDKGVDNVLWTYSPDRVSDISQYMERYPGDKYVDIMGADVYHFNGAEGTPDYIETADRTLGIAAQAAREHGKLLAFTETGCESLPITDWYTSILLPIISRHPVSYVTVWRNAHDKPSHFYTPWPGHPAEGDFRKFSEDTHTTFVNPKK